MFKKRGTSSYEDYFSKHVATPYLSSVFSRLAGLKKPYLTSLKTKLYLDLPELLGSKIVRQINYNGDERVTHQQFLGFFLALLCGSWNDQLVIAFKCYDSEGKGKISGHDVRSIMANLEFQGASGSILVTDTDASIK